MTNLRDYLTYDLYPALFDSLDTEGVFPEFAFKKTGKGYQSTTNIKYDGREGRKAGQVIVYANSYNNFTDHSESPEQKDIIDYVRFHRSGEEVGFLTAVNTLAKMAGVKPFQIELTDKEREEYERNKKRSILWKAVVDFCADCLKNHKENSEAVRSYLIEQRKYNFQDIAAMQLGFLPSQDLLFAHLKHKFSEEEIRDTINLNGIGFNGYKLIIPIRYGQLYTGIAARNVQYVPGSENPKYLFSTGYKRGQTLYNLTGRVKNGRVLIVEGQLDAGIAEARGFDYAKPCAIGGKHLTEEQVKQIGKAKVKESYLCLDNERDTIPNTIKAIEAIQMVESIEDRIFIVSLPEGVKDVDLLVTTQGVEQLTEITKHAVEFYYYLVNDVTERFKKLREQEGGPTAHNKQQFFEDLQTIAQRIKNPINRQDFYSFIIKELKGNGIDITEESFKDAVERLEFKADQAKQDEELKKLLTKAEATRAAGNAPEAVKQIEEKIREVKLKDKTTEFKAFLSADQSEAGVRQRYQNKPESVTTGYTIESNNEVQNIELPAGALTFIAAATNHGKTAMLINLSINIITSTPNKNVYLFTYEEDKDKVIGNALNTFVNEEISANNRRSITYFLRTGDKKYFRPDHDMLTTFESKKDMFFHSYLIPGRLKIIYLDYSADELITFIHFIAKTDPNAVILIDYIQKLRSDKKGNQTNRITELKFICEDLNNCSIDSGLPIALGAQFNREVKNPLQMHPTRIAEASDIEKTASEIFGLWNCTKKMEGETNQLKEVKGVYGLETPEPSFILQILKSRNIESGKHTKLNWHGNTAKISQRFSLKFREDGF